VHVSIGSNASLVSVVVSKMLSKFENSCMRNIYMCVCNDAAVVCALCRCSFCL
jgi:hypothetical protein